MELTNTSPDKRRLFGRWFARRITTYLSSAHSSPSSTGRPRPITGGWHWVAAGWGSESLALSLVWHLTDCADENNYRLTPPATMKAWKLVLTVIFALASVAAAAKTLEITVTDIRMRQ